MVNGRLASIAGRPAERANAARATTSPRSCTKWPASASTSSARVPRRVRRSRFIVGTPSTGSWAPTARKLAPSHSDQKRCAGREIARTPALYDHGRLVTMAREVVDIASKLSVFSQHWSPKVVARLNDYEIKVVKLQGEFVWHTHEETDELFLVVHGELTIQLRDGNVAL